MTESTRGNSPDNHDAASVRECAGCDAARPQWWRACRICGHRALSLRAEVDWFVGFNLGLTWAYGCLWIGLGPCQVVIGRG